MASKEKALADKLLHTKKLNLQSISDLKSYLFDDLRVDIAQIKTLSQQKINQLSDVYNHKNVDLLKKYLDTENE